MKKIEPSARHLFKELSKKWMDLDVIKREKLKFLLIKDRGQQGFLIAYAEG